ncbi:MAG TPA: hypothetical protein VLU99_08190 [Nitrososphaerales archaeon]|nr:hypothetical protein [Nitrososphaerales archaeon]
MFPATFLAPVRTTPKPVSSPDAAGKLSPRARRNLTALGIVLIVFLALLLYGLGTFSSPPASSTVETTASTSYGTPASSVIGAAANYLPAGYAQGSSRQLNANESGLVSAADALYSNQGGALANMTILVFSSPASAETYITSVISNAKALSGYSDATSTLGGYQRYGVCYGYAESDPEGAIYVANGVCTKGNVYIQVHLATSSSLPSAEGDMAGFVGAAYSGLG